MLATVDSRTSDERLRDWLIVRGITVAFVLTALAKDLVRADWGADTRPRNLLTGADRLLGRPCAGLPFALVNNYGPTECTVVATSAILPPGDQECGLPVIGYPVSGTTICILNDLGARVAAGEQGDIFVGGPQVARGYRLRPDVNTERFVTIDGARCYRTGDRGVWSDDVA